LIDSGSDDPRRLAAWFKSEDQTVEMAICRVALKACLYLEGRTR